MSIKVSRLVWASGVTPPSTRLVLLCLADLAGDDGGRLWPSMATIARRCQISDRQAQRIMKSLIEGGIVEVLKNAAGGPPGRTPNYRICLARLASMQAPAPAADDTHDADALTGDSRDGNGDAHDADRDTGDVEHDTYDGKNVMGVTRTITAITAIQNRENGYGLAGNGYGGGPAGAGIAPGGGSPDQPAPQVIEGEMWTALCAAPQAFSLGELSALHSRAVALLGEGNSPDVVGRTLGVLLEPKNRGLRQFPRFLARDPSTRSPATKAAPLRQPRTFTTSTHGNAAIAHKTAAPAPDKFAALAAQMKK